MIRLNQLKFRNSVNTTSVCSLSMHFQFKHIARSSNSVGDSIGVISRRSDIGDRDTTDIGCSILLDYFNKPIGERIWFGSLIWWKQNLIALLCVSEVWLIDDDLYFIIQSTYIVNILKYWGIRYLCRNCSSFTPPFMYH